MKSLVFTTVKRYLAKQARLPKVEPEIINDIHAWARVHYLQNILAISPKRDMLAKEMGLSRIQAPRVATKVFPVYSKDYPLTESKIKVKVLAKFFPFSAQYNSVTNTLFIGLPEYLTRKSLKNLSLHLAKELDEDLRSFIHHELIHFIQFNTEKSIGGKQEFLDNFEDYQDEYFASPVEFKPQLASELHNFKLLKIQPTKVNLESFIHESRFFQALKHLNYPQYKKAVKDFYLLVT